MTDAMAAVNLVLGTLGFGWLLWRTSRRWEEYPSELRLLLALTLGLFFCLLVVSSEVLFSDEKLVGSIFIIFLVKCFALYVLWQTRETKYRTGTRIPGSGPQAGDVDKDIP